MMDSSVPISSALQDFLLDAQVLLTQCQECLQHLHLIANDPDACHCLSHSLDTLARRASQLGLREIGHYASGLQQLLAPACHEQMLNPDALVRVNACLTLLAWQLELVDPRTGQLALDTCEQVALLSELAIALNQPPSQTCATCLEQGDECAHPHAPMSAGSTPSGPTQAH